jgi:hypothetical protein
MHCGTLSLLTVGTNMLAFRLNNGSPTAFNNAQYDALRLEIN